MEKVGDSKWLKLALLEASIFTPYYPLATNENNSEDVAEFVEYSEEALKLAEEKAKAKNKELFESMKSYKIDFDRLSEISVSTLGESEKDFALSSKKAFDKYQDIISDRLTKNVLVFGGAAIGATVLAVASAGLAGPIAIALVGPAFPGLAGAALTAASLAAVGGGALAVGGAGMAGGAALIVGGGAILGLIGGGGAIIGAEKLRSINKGTFTKADFEAMVQSLAKLVTVTVRILEAVLDGTDIVDKILLGIREVIRIYRDIADDMDLDIGNKNQKDSLNYVLKIIDALKKAYELIQKNRDDKVAVK